jgi:cytochrome c oxidase subunit IV
MSELSTHDPKPVAHHAPDFQAYMVVFGALCVFTALSFLANLIFGQGHTSMYIIMVIAVIKATLVGIIFMHLKTDWPKVYCIIIPVSVMGVMMMIVLLPDIVISWHHYFYN